MGGSGIIVGAASAALVVVTGALYALCFALGRLRRSTGLAAAGWASYGLLVLCTIVFMQALALDGLWRVVVAAMLVGYLLAPRAIWHLCVATHDDDVEVSRSGTNR